MQPSARAAGVFGRHPRLPILLLVILPFVVHLPQWLLPIHGDPFWQFSFLASGVRHTSLPGQAYLDPYIAFTSQSFGPLIARDWFHGVLPWWNPYVGIGVPLAGQMQPGAFFLPFIFLLAIPGGVTLLAISIQIVCGISTYALLRELKISTVSALTGGALYALNGTIAWAPGPASVFCTLAFLPLLLWAIERARIASQGAAATLAVGVAIAYSLLAGFPETAYLDGWLALSWAVFRVARSPRPWMVAQRIIVGGSLGILLTAPLLIAFAQELASSDTLTGHLSGFSFRPLRSLPMLLMPTVYGPINSGTSGGAGMAGVWGSVGGYSSALIAFFATLSFTGRAPEKGSRLLLLGATMLTLAKTFGLPPAMWLVNALPMMKLMSFDRYAAPCWELALIVLAMFGLDVLRKEQRGVRSALTITLSLLAVLIILAWPARRWSSLPGLIISELLILSALWAIALPLVIWFACRRFSLRSVQFTAVGLLVAEAAAMFCMPQVVGFIGGDLDLSIVRFLQSHAGSSRVVTLGPLTPNYGAAFGFSEINHNMSPIPKVWLDHINTRLLPKFVDVDGGVTFWPIKQAPLDGASAALALQQHLADYQELDVRYAVTFPGQEPAPAFFLETPKGSGIPLALQPGQSTTIQVKAPEVKQPVREVGVLINTYAGHADGALLLQLCSERECRSGRNALNAKQDGAFLFVSLDAPLPVSTKDLLRLHVVHEGGSKPVGLWIWPHQIGDAQVTEGPTRKLPAAVRLGFRDSGQVTQAKLVFTSRVADAWELPGPKSYFDSNGVCQLSASGRESVNATCPYEAVLIRRELFMPGWRAEVNGVATSVRPHGPVLQEITLPSGRSAIRFQFTPPYMSYGWFACIIGASGLGWQIIRLRRNTVPATT